MYSKRFCMSDNIFTDSLSCREKKHLAFWTLYLTSELCLIHAQYISNFVHFRLYLKVKDIITHILILLLQLHTGIYSFVYLNYSIADVNILCITRLFLVYKI